MQRSMMLFPAAVLVSTTVLGIVVSACGSSDPPPPTTPSAQPYPPQQGYYPPQQGGYPPPQQGGYPQPGPTGAPPADPNAGGQMATPGPLALPCQNDSACGFARCNVQFQKCAFPCVNAAVDCLPGNACTMGFCGPKAPGQP